MEGLRLEVAFDVCRPTASDMNRRTAKEREGRRSVSVARNPLDPLQVHEFRTARSDESGPEPLFEVREAANEDIARSRTRVQTLHEDRVALRRP